jgi:hypothetical protein
MFRHDGQITLEEIQDFQAKLKQKLGVVDHKTVDAVENILEPRTLMSLWKIRDYPEGQGTSQLESFHAELSRLKVHAASQETLEWVKIKVGMAILKHNKSLLTGGTRPIGSWIIGIPVIFYYKTEYAKGSSFESLQHFGYKKKKNRTDQWSLQDKVKLIEALGDVDNNQYPELKRPEYMISSRHLDHKSEWEIVSKIRKLVRSKIKWMQEGNDPLKFKF